MTAFRHGDRVQYKVPPVGRISAGVIVGYPRGNSVVAHIKWPDGWSGFESLSLLEHVPTLFEEQVLRAARAVWVPSARMLEWYDAAVARTTEQAAEVFHGRDRWRVQKP